MKRRLGSRHHGSQGSSPSFRGRALTKKDLRRAGGGPPIEVSLMAKLALRMSMSPALASGVGAFFGIARVEFQPQSLQCPMPGCLMLPALPATVRIADEYAACGRVWLGHVDQSGRGPYHSIPLSPRARPPSPCARRLPRGSTKAWGRVLRVRSSSVKLRARLEMLETQSPWARLKARLEMLGIESPWARLRARLEMLGTEPLSEVESSLRDAQD
ncbi:hypothetical protein B296_00039172 [Ensete ventricosum]|uniref:Uncharacterized protein n=1 Tax=Ensete ventricosum TaxID=4639 RepID=A0A426Y0W5_ENSVE|nr:hypothetical protein B296_00039172 [Ensete ventricosum]